jgi:NhaP-type Na+/H+ or K+/H+ antiporter
MVGLLVLAILVVAYGLVSRRFEGTIISAPMVFVAGGLLLGFLFVELHEVPFEYGLFLVIGEIALVLTLFTDASRIRLRDLRGEAQLPGRMLIIGLPLTIFLGTVAAALLFTNLTIWEAAILGTILAPTDAGLGHAVASSHRVPLRIRQTLNVEAGLNDGISIPFLTLFIALAVAEELVGPFHWVGFTLAQIGFGVLTGLAVGLGGGWLVAQSTRRGWITGIYQYLVLLALAIIAWLAAGLVGGNGFISAFVAGLAIALIFKDGREKVITFAEAEGQLLNLVVLFVFGVIAVPRLPEINGAVVLYAVLSLTLVRMLPVALSLIGTQLQRSTVLFLGWFGPRGLASIVLGLTLVEESALPGQQTIILVMIATVLLSVFAHGASAVPLTHRYGRRADSLEETAPEMQDVVEMPTRLGAVRKKAKPVPVAPE